MSGTEEYYEEGYSVALERTLRRDTFEEGVTVVLGDGQEWHLPSPKIRFLPEFDDKGKFSIWSKTTYGPEHDRDLAILLGFGDIDQFERLTATFSLVARLVMRNYDIDNDQLAKILYMDDEPETAVMWSSIMQIVQGRSPKRSATGSETPSSSAESGLRISPTSTKPVA